MSCGSQASLQIDSAAGIILLPNCCDCQFVDLCNIRKRAVLSKDSENLQKIDFSFRAYGTRMQWWSHSIRMLNKGVAPSQVVLEKVT